MNSAYTGSILPSDTEGTQFLHEQFNITQKEWFSEIGFDAEKQRLKSKGRKIPNKVPEILEKQLRHVQAVLDHPEKFPALKEQVDTWLEEYKRDAVIDLGDEQRLAQIATSLYAHERKIAIERGHGADIANLDTAQVIEKYKEAIHEKSEVQDLSLQTWINYLTDPATSYPMWFRYYVLYSLKSMGEFRRWDAVYTRRTQWTIAPFPEFNAESLSWVYGVLSQWVSSDAFEDKDNKDSLIEQVTKLLWKKRFAELYAFAQVEATGSIDRRTTQGRWVVYKQWSDSELLKKSLNGKWTGWCTAEWSAAQQQLKAGDFHVYYTLNTEGDATEPRIAIRMQGDAIAEIRGINERQELELELTDIMEAQWLKLGWYEHYKEITADMKQVRQLCMDHFDIDPKTGDILQSRNIPYTAEEIILLSRDINGFGHGNDPRMNKFREDLLEIPDGTIFEDYVSFTHCKFLKKIWSWVFFKWGVDFSDSAIKEIADDQPQWVYVLCLIQTGRVKEIPNGTIFENAVSFEGCNSLTKIAKWVVFKWYANFRNSRIEEIPDGTIFEKGVLLYQVNSLRKIGKRVVFRWDANLVCTMIEEIPDGTIFEKDAVFSDCPHLRRIGKRVVFKWYANFRSSGIREVPEWVIFERQPVF